MQANNKLKKKEKKQKILRCKRVKGGREGLKERKIQVESSAA